MTQEYQDISCNFLNNIRRVKHLGFVPIEINHWSMIFMGCFTRAAHALQKALPSGPIDPDIMALANSYANDFNKNFSKLSEVDRESNIISHSGENISNMIRKDSSGELFEGHHAIMAAMITEAWSAFEAMASDLWVAALNKHPETLARAFIEKNPKKEITLSQMLKYNFDIRRRMGDLLLDFGKVKFDSWNNIKSNYQHSFPLPDNEKMFGDTSILYIAEKTRHLIAHRSGVIDEKYANEVSSFKPYDCFAIGQRIPLDGHIVSAQVSACIKSGVSLLRYVDAWSQSHQ